LALATRGGARRAGVARAVAAFTVAPAWYPDVHQPGVGLAVVLLPAAGGPRRDAALARASDALVEVRLRNPVAPRLAVLTARLWRLRAEGSLARGDRFTARTEIGAGEAALLGAPPTADTLAAYAALRITGARAARDPAAARLSGLSAAALLEAARDRNPHIREE
jgi:hypothetical protein